MKKIDTSGWKKFRVGELFDIQPTKGRNTYGLEDDGDIPYVAASRENNGVQKLVNCPAEWISDGNCLVFVHIGDAAAGVCHYMPVNFVGMNGKTSCAYNEHINELTGEFLSAVITKTNNAAYSFAESWTGNRLKNTLIYLPSTPSGDPDWEYMEKYMAKVMKESEVCLENLRSADEKKTAVDVSKWKPFAVSDFFEVLKGRNKLSNADIGEEGSTPVYSSNSDNNGIIGYTARFPDYIINSSCPLYVVFGDHTKAINIAEKSFCVMDNVKVLSTKIKNCNILRFIMTSWMCNVPNLGYARHWSVAKETTIWLPATPSGDPDWSYMEAYMSRVMQESASCLDGLAPAIAD